MKFLSKDDLLGSFIPKPYISKVTLESAGYSSPPKISNPHIDAGHGGTSAWVPSNLVDSDRVMFFGEGPPADLVVSVDLIIKDKVPQIPIFRSEGLELRRYINLCIVQSTSADDTEFLMSKANSYKNSLYNEIERSSQRFVMKKISLADIVDEKLQNRVSDEIAGGSNRRMLIKDNGYKVQFDVNAAGGPIPFQPDYLSYCVWTEFDVEKLALEFEFDGADIDVARLFRGMEFRSKVVCDVVIRGGKAAHIAYIFRNESGAIWTGAATDVGGGNYWTGRWVNARGGGVAYNMDPDPRSGPDSQPARVVHRHEGQWWTGYEHDEDLANDGYQLHVIKELVKKQRVKNTRIRDFRAVARLEKLNLDFSYIENNLMKDILKTSRTLSTYKKGNTHKYFSDMFLTRDVENNCRFFFAMRKDKILQDISPLGALYQKGVIPSNFCRIVSIKVYRVRTKGSSELGSEQLRPQKPYSFGIKNPLDFNNQNEYEGSYDFLGGNRINTHSTTGHELIFESFDGNIVSIDGADSAIKDVGNIFTRNEEGFPNLDPDVSYFTGVDKSIKNKTDGYYQYKISFEIKDGAPQYLKTLYTSLKSTKKDLEDYFIEASKLGTTRIKDFTDNPHIENENLMGFKEGGQPIQRTPGETRPGNFDMSLNRFTRQFIDFAKTHSEWQNNFWNGIVVGYTAALEGLGVLGVNDELRTKLTNYIRPQTGNLQGIMTLKKLIENLEGILLRGMKGLTPVRSPGESAGGSELQPYGKALVSSQIIKKCNKAPQIKNIKIEHQFDSTFNANLPDNVGLNIFGLDPVDDLNIGFREIGDNEFQFIRTEEMQKIYKAGIEEIPSLADTGIPSYNLVEDSYSYFTPSVVRTPMQSVDLRTINNVPTAETVPPNSLLSSYANVQRDMATSTNISFPLASFMASSYNLIVVPDIEPEVRVMGPGSANLTTPGDYYRASGINQSYLDEMGNHARKVEDSTLIFSELLDHVSLPADPNSIGKIAMRKAKKDLSMYSQQTADGYYYNILSLNPPQGEGPTSFLFNQTMWDGFPNQVKALFILANHSEVGLNTYFQDDTVSLLNKGMWSTMLQRAKTRYKFESLYVLECFTGWRKITEAVGASKPTTVPSLMVSNDPNTARTKPTWSKLDVATYTTAKDAGRVLLCRLKEYSNPLVGIEEQRELPLFEQFFILNPAGAGTSIPTMPIQEVPVEITLQNEDISSFLQTSEFMRESRNTAFDVSTNERARTDTPRDMSGDDVQGDYNDA